MSKLLNGNWNPGDYVEFVKKYIEEHYMKEIQLRDLAAVSWQSCYVRLRKKLKKPFLLYLPESITRYWYPLSE